MREILFRGKSEHNGLLEYGYFIREYGSDKVLIDHGDGTQVYVIPETVGQYTGLKDKNGTKIFEGDIIRIVQYDDLNITKDAVVSFGEFSDINCGEALFCGFYIFTEEVVASILNGKAEGFWFINLCEIIGSIHDNKTK